jgi:hypothetical protein
MTAMYAIERADCQYAATVLLAQVMQASNKFHRGLMLAAIILAKIIGDRERPGPLKAVRPAVEPCDRGLRRSHHRRTTRPHWMTKDLRGMITVAAR